MEYPSKRQKISRIDIRQRRVPAPRLVTEENVRNEFEIESLGRASGPPREELDAPLLLREMKGREIMGHKHHLFHRHQAPEARAETTIIVDVIATVDSSGSVIGVQTVPVLPSVPAVPPFPTDLTVPAVPQVTSVAFPSVPAYPFPSGVSEAGDGSQTVLSSSFSAPATIPGSSTLSLPLPTSSSSSPGRNSTTTGTTASSFSSLSFSRNSTTTSSTQPSTSSIRSTSSSALSSISLSVSSLSSSISETSLPSSTVAGGGFGGGAGNPTPSATQTAPAGNGTGDSVDDSTIPTPEVVGSVIGSLAGLAIILAIVLFILRRYKRQRKGALHLPDNDATDSRQIAGAGQPMAQHSSVATAGAASLFSRFSASSKGTAAAGGQERGFQRISGRKLPSAFSEGMTSEQFDKNTLNTLSGSSFYRDSQGFYGGPGVSGAATAATAAAAAESSRAAALEKEKMMPSPARTPVIHHPDEFAPLGGARSPGGKSPLGTPPRSPIGQPPRPTLGRSHPSEDGSRTSKFTENV